MIYAYWHESANFGDRLTPWLIERITGERPVYTALDSPRKKLILSGSVLNLADENCVVFGAGVAYATDPVKQTSIVAVRGPLSRARAQAAGVDCPDFYCDPGFLIPLFREADAELHPSHRPAHRPRDLGYVALVPHYVDQERIMTMYPPTTPFVCVPDVLGSGGLLVEQIMGASLVISSSLHGLVVALAYGVPCIWARFGTRILGDDTKYLDVFASVGLDAFCLNMRGLLPRPEALAEMRGVTAARQIDSVKALEALRRVLAANWAVAL